MGKDFIIIEGDGEGDEYCRAVTYWLLFGWKNACTAE